MSDPLSIAAGIAGLAGLALHGIRQLSDDVNNISEAPKVLANLREDLTSVRLSLEALEIIDESHLRTLGTQVYDQIKVAIVKCTSTCDDFHGDLRSWTKRSRIDGKLSWRDRTNVGIFKMRRITVMGQQLQNCRLTLNSVAVTATLYTTIRDAANTQEIKEMLSARQAEMTSTILVLDTQISSAERSLALFQPAENGRFNEQDAEDMESAMWAVKEEVAMLRASQEIMRSLIASVQAKLVEGATGGVSNYSTSVSFGDNNRGFQVGTHSGSISHLSFVSR